jgi:L-lactate dehydrogenase complex protein LldG
MTSHNDLIGTFREKAEAVSSVVAFVSSTSEALDYAVDLCDKQPACRLLLSGCEAPLSDRARALCEAEDRVKVIAVPDLDDGLFTRLEEMAASRDMSAIRDGLRDHAGGLEVSLTHANYGIAETGTLVLDSRSEDLRLATMLAETHVAMLPVSRIRTTAYDLEPELNSMIGVSPSFTAFITGASRTADIERVLALGVHGPLELHILLVEDR